MRLRSRKTLFILVLVGLLTSGIGCQSGTNGEGEGDDAGFDSGSDTDSYDDDYYYCDWYCDDAHKVASPPHETPADLESICDETGTVESNLAAKVKLTAYSAWSPNLVTGSIEIPSQIREAMIGEPVIDVTDAYPEELYSIEVSDLTPSPDGYTFNAKWPAISAGHPHMVIRVTMELPCDDEEGLDSGVADGGSTTRIVKAFTYFEWCSLSESYEDDSEGWVGSGDMCYDCECTWGEMAPTPIMPCAESDGLALPWAMQVEIVKMAAFDHSVVLLAEHKGAKGPVEYQWQATGGEILDSDLGGVIWKLPNGSGPHLIQVAVRDSESAAVAAMRI